MIVDAHHHLWDPARRDYPWMTGAFAPLRRPIGLNDLRAVTEPAGVTATVVVQAAATEEETLELLRAAELSHGLVAAVVGWVDLTAPDVAERIAALREAPGGDRLAGIRHNVHDEPDPEWLEREDVRRGLRAVADAGLAYDLLLFPEHLAPALRRRRRDPRSGARRRPRRQAADRRRRLGAVERRSRSAGRPPARALQALRARHRGGVGGLARATTSRARAPGCSSCSGPNG